MYNILSETDYQERLLPPTPPRAKTPLSPGPTSLPLGQHPEQQRAGSEQWRGTPLIDACPPGGGASWREAHRSRSRDGRASVFRRGRQQVQRSFVGQIVVLRSAQGLQCAQYKSEEPPPTMDSFPFSISSEVVQLAGRGSCDQGISEDIVPGKAIPQHCVGVCCSRLESGCRECGRRSEWSRQLPAGLLRDGPPSGNLAPTSTECRCSL